MKINPKQIEKAMKRMGIHATPIDAEEVIIKTPTKEIIISSPQVSRVNMMGQDTFQISGVVTERERHVFTDDDIRMVAEKSGASFDEAKTALEETGDIAEAILKLKS